MLKTAGESVGYGSEVATANYGRLPARETSRQQD